MDVLGVKTKIFVVLLSLALDKDVCPRALPSVYALSGSPRFHRVLHCSSSWASVLGSSRSGRFSLQHGWAFLSKLNL